MAMNTEEVTERLVSRYESTDWAHSREVPDSTGHARSRCDLLAMSLWKSKGIALHGHEVKVSRSDWRKELDDVTKAYPVQRFCHYWWIVAPKKIVDLKELPAEWGLMECSENSAIRVKKRAPRLDPDPFTYEFLAACFRSFGKGSDIERIRRAAKAQGFQEGREYERRRVQDTASTELQSAQRLSERLQQNIRQFEEASGIELGAYHGGKIGEAVKAWMLLDRIKLADNLKVQMRAINQLLEAMEQ